MIDLVIFIIFLVGLTGLGFILFRKLPVLVSLPQNGTTGIKKHQIILNIEHKIKEVLASFEKQIIMHKILSWVKVMTLRFETKVDQRLHGIRKKAQKADKKASDKK